MVASVSDITKVTKKLLHVGCGGAGRAETHHSFQGAEWEHVRLDIDPEMKPDIVSSMVHLEGVEDESVDGIYSSHNMEHLHPRDVKLAAKSFHRVLKDRGRIVIVVPDFELACEQVIRGEGTKTMYVSPAGPICAMDIIFGYSPYTLNNPFMQHRTGFTKEWMHILLVDQGFHNVEVVTTENFDLWAYARKTA